MVPRVTKRKETRREQEMHVDDGVEEPFFEPHQIVMEQEELGTSDYDNSEDVTESVKLVKVSSSAILYFPVTWIMWHCLVSVICTCSLQFKGV